MAVRKNREEVASFAYKIARSKTAVDKAGAALSAEYKEIPKKIDANRRAYKDAFESLQAEVRKPLLSGSKAEEARKTKHQQGINKIVLRQECADLDSKELNANIEWLESVLINESWEEFEENAHRAKAASLAALASALTTREKYEADQAELERLRAEAEQQAQRDREGTDCP